jgi:peptide/nickel transport system substrate-binding protein
MFRVRLALLPLAALALVVLPAAAAHVTRYGGTVVVGLTADPDSMDPTVSRGTGVTIYRDMCWRLYEMMNIHGLDTPVPQLAASLPVRSKDKLSYTVQLRQGVLFNDGTPLNAAAVVTSYQRFVTYPGSTRATDFADVAGVTAAGPDTVVFHMAQPDSSFTSNMYVFSPAALAAEGANFGQDPVCAGPFEFDHRVVGDNVTIVKSPWFWDRNDVHLDKIVFKPYPDAAAATAALESGDVQVLASVPGTQVPALQENANLRELKLTSIGFDSIVINVGNKNGLLHPYQTLGSPLASSPVLRQAFEEAIDRATLVKVVDAGLAVPSCTPVSPGNEPWFGLTKIPCTPYDPQDARRLVAKSGSPNPTVHLLSANDTTSLALAQFIQAEEAAVGINVVLDTTDSSTELARLTAGSFDAALNSWSGQGDPNGNTYRFFDTAGTSNYGGYSSPRMDYVLANGLKAVQQKDRAVNYRVAQQIAQNDRPRIFLDAPLQVTAYSTSVGGIAINNGGQLLLGYAQLK